jgi:hypothetical protein
MADNNEYFQKLSHALRAKADWLEKTEIPKLKDGFKTYRTSFAFLYNLYIKNGLIKEDPYKNDTPVQEIEVPNTAEFKDEEKLDELTKRLSAYDNQLDFLMNTFQVTPDNLTLDRIRKISGLLKFIDWTHLSTDAGDLITLSVAKMTGTIMSGNDPMTLKITTESTTNLNKFHNTIMAALKHVTDYQREAYKLDLRDVTDQMAANEASDVNLIKKKFLQAKPGAHFYPDLAEEAIREDHAKEGPDLRNKVLKKLEVAEAKPQEAPKASAKTTLIEGLNICGNMAKTFSHIAGVMDGNRTILDNRKKSFIETLKELFSKGGDNVIYEVKYTDPVRKVPVFERVNFSSFRADLDKLIHRLTPLVAHGSAASKLEAMTDEQLLGVLERDMREIQALHKILTALDEFFKTEVPAEDREKIRGIKPELATIKDSIVKANSKRHDYSAQKEEEEQLKHMGAAPKS